MNQALFNGHDLILLLTAFECFAITGVILSLRRPVSPLLSILALVLMCYGAVAINEMILWGETFRYVILNVSVNLFFCLSFTYLCAGPLCWLFAKQLRGQAISINQFALHLIPALMILGYFGLTFWNLPVAEKVSLIENYHFDNSWHYRIVEFASSLHRWAYTLVAIYLIWPLAIQQNQALPSEAKERKGFVIAFILVVFFELLYSLLKFVSAHMSAPIEGLGGLGLVINYGNFLLVNLFIYLWLRSAFSKAEPKQNKKQAIAVKDDYIAKIEQGIHQQALYLNPNLTVERFARAVDLVPKEFSRTINHHYGMTFIEFINQYRIEEARKLLENPEYSYLNITDIFYRAGFNSKSVYNKLFKEKYQCTPSEFRKLHRVNS